MRLSFALARPLALVLVLASSAARAADSPPAGAKPLTAERWYHLKVVVRGPKATLLLDGKTICEHRLDSFTWSPYPSRGEVGLIARGTMQNANMAAALGVNPPRVYAITFGIGAALSGLAGAVLAPVSGVFPTIGVAYVAKSFITVIGGGAAILTGTVSASALFGTINQITTFVTTPVFGEVALLGAAIVLIRLLPQGITGRFFRRGM